MAASEQSVLVLEDVLDAGRIGKRKDVSDLDEDQIVMARWLGLGTSKMAGLLRVFPVSSG